MRLEPHAIARLGARLQRGSAVISATNGKTTTAAMVAGILERAGAHLVHNRAGANMAGGVATALHGGPRGGDTGLFEVDEFWLGQVVDELQPRALLLANLFRDQLDRYGELDSIADRWADVAARTSAALVLNADDPTVADLGRTVGATYFGVQDDAMALPAMQHAADATHCRHCGAPYRYDAVYLGHLGRYHCDACGATRPDPQVSAHDIVLEGVRGARFTLRTPAGDRAIALPLPGLYNVYNALGAAALALALGATLIRSTPACTPSRPPSGAPRRCASAGASCRSCWSRTRRAPMRSCARSCSRTASTTSSPCSTTTSPTGAT